jgi:hypothetical protein
MDMKQTIDADQIKALIDQRTAENLTQIKNYSEQLKESLDEYVRNSAMIGESVGALFQSATFFGVKETVMEWHGGETARMTQMNLRLDTESGSRSIDIHAYNEPRAEIPAGRYRVVVALIPVKE